MKCGRWQAIGKLLHIIQKKQTSPYSPHLILGDLNSVAPHDRVSPRSSPHWVQWAMLLQLNHIFRLALPRLLKAGYTDCFRHLHPESDGFTWTTDNLSVRYDYILANPDLAPMLQTCQVFNHLEAVLYCF